MDDAKSPASVPTEEAKKGKRLRWLIALGACAVVVAAVGGAALRARRSATARVVSAADCDGREECAPLCDREQWPACTRLATLHWFARGGKRDLGKAEELYQRACDAGEPLGCFSLARLYSDALPMQQKSGKAPDLLRLAAEGFDRDCKAGRPRACLELAAMYQSGRGIDKSADKATSLQELAAPMLDRECQSGVGRSCAELSNLAFSGAGTPKDSNRSLGLLQRACELGDRRACARAGSYFLLGRPDIPKDPARASSFYKQGCDLQDWAACHAWGRMLLDGTGVPTDAKGAARVLQSACDHDNAPACRELARLHAQGLGVKKDPGREADLLSRYLSLRAKACADGSQDDCAELARDYRTGDTPGIPLDPPRARDLDEQELRIRQEACDAGSIIDCDQLRSRLEGKPQYAARLRTVRERQCQLGARDECRKLQYDKIIEREGK